MSKEWEDDGDEGNLVLDRPPARERLKPPAQYHVVMLNDDFTPMDFVVALLKQGFGRTEEDAERITHEIHTKGKGVATPKPLSLDMAETKAAMANGTSQEYGHPLKCEPQQVEL